MSGIRQAGSAVLSFGKSMLSATGNTQSMVTALGDLVGAVPVIGPLINKTTGFLYTMLQRMSEVRGEQNRWQVQLAGLNSDLSALTPQIQAISNAVGMSAVEVYKLTRSMGNLSKAGVDLVDSTAKVSRAFDIATDDAAAFLKTTDALGVAGQDFKKLGGQALIFGKQFKIPDLMAELPELADDARRSMLLLGGSFKGRITPAVQTVARAAGVLSDRLGMMPKQALKVAKGMLGQFQDLAVNLERVFTGVDDDFEQGTQDLMEMFVRSGRSGAAAFTAIQKAATDMDFTDIANAFDDVMKRGGIGARRMKAQLQKTFGPEFDTIMKGMSDEAKKNYEKMFGTPSEDPVAVFEKSTKRMLDSADNIDAKLNAMANNFVESAAANMPAFMTQVESAFGFLLEKGAEGQKKLGEYFAKMDAPLAEGFKTAVDTYLVPAIEKLGSWVAEKLSGALGPVGADLKYAADIFSGLVGHFRRIADNFRDVMHYVSFGKIESSEQMAAKELDTIMMEQRSARAAKELERKKASAEAEAKYEAEQAVERKSYNQLMESLSDEDFARAVSFMKSSGYRAKAQDVRVHLGITGKTDLRGALKFEESYKTIDSTGGPVPANK
jgi:hypothetical protein